MRKLSYFIIGLVVLATPLTASAANGVGTYKNDYQRYQEFYEFYGVDQPSDFKNKVHYTLGRGDGLFRSLVIDNTTRDRVLTEKGLK